MTAFSPRERFNWGYWDGRHDRERGRYPEWAKASVYQCKHPFDPIYGLGYWAGRYDESGATTSDAAWAARPKLKGRRAICA